jgi:hypothetical protein
MTIGAFSRITFSPEVMGGRACVRGMRITVALVLNLVESRRRRGLPFPPPHPGALTTVAAVPPPSTPPEEALQKGGRWCVTLCRASSPMRSGDRWTTSAGRSACTPSATRWSRWSPRPTGRSRSSTSEARPWRDDVLETLRRPTRVLCGGEGEQLAVHEVAEGKWLVVVYRGGDADGFVITAFLTRRLRSVERRKVLWP